MLLGEGGKGGNFSDLSPLISFVFQHARASLEDVMSTFQETSEVGCRAWTDCGGVLQPWPHSSGQRLQFEGVESAAAKDELSIAGDTHTLSPTLSAH